MANNHSTLTGLFTDIADAIRAKGGGGGDTLTWDGNTEGLESVADLYYKVSDIVLTESEIADGCVFVDNTGYAIECNRADDTIMCEDGVVVLYFGSVFFITEDAVGVDLDGLVFNSPGVYFAHDPNFLLITSLTIPGYTGFASKIVADNFPEAIAAIDTQEDLDPELTTQDDLIAQIATALEGKTGATAEDLSAEMTAQDEAIASQDDLIAQIAAALEGKTGASGSAVDIPTCTVFISDDGNNTAYINGVYATIYDKNSNVISSYKYSGYTVLTHVVENVIKGTPILVYGIYDYSDSIGATRIFSTRVNDYTGPSMISLFEVNDTSAYINLSNSSSEPEEPN